MDSFISVRRYGVVEMVIKRDMFRKLQYEFFSLPYITVMSIAIDLDLIKNEDRGLTDLQQYKLFLERAKNSCMLKRLENRVTEERNK